MKTVGWFSVEEQIRSATAVNTWKVVNFSIPLRLRDRYIITPEKMIIIEEPRLLFSENCLRWRGARQWNQLPPEIRTQTSIGAFKRQIRRHILDLREQGPILPL